MQAALRLKTTVLPGHRIEFTARELTEGEEVELIVLKPEKSALQPSHQFASAWEYLQSLKSAQHTSEEWDAIECELQAEKDACDR